MKIKGKASDKIEFVFEQDPLFDTILNPGECKVRTIRTIKGTFLVIIRYLESGEIKVVSKKIKEGRYKV